MEFTKEEKRAIETLEIEGTENNYLEVKILLNLVEKQQKEIEELKQELINQSIADLKELNNYISKDKIRELLEEYKNTGYYEVEHVLEELLEEK